MSLEKCEQVLQLLDLTNERSKWNEILTGMNDDKTMFADVIDVLEDPTSSEDTDQLCERLFEFYQFGGLQCQVFVLQFVPSLLSMCFSWLRTQGNWCIGKIEAILLTIYNQEVHRNTETPFATSFRIPSLSKSSVYHEPANSLITSSALTVRALTRHEQSEKPVLFSGPFKILDRIPASSRLIVMKVVLEQYNLKLCAITEPSQKAFCRLAYRLAKSGFPVTQEDDKCESNVVSNPECKYLQRQPRIKLSSGVVQELLQGLHYIMHNGLADCSCEAVQGLKLWCSQSVCACSNLITQSLHKISTRDAVSEGTFQNVLMDPYQSRLRQPAMSKIRGISTCKHPLVLSAKDEKNFVNVSVRSAKFASNEITVNVSENGKETGNISIKTEIADTESRHTNVNNDSLDESTGKEIKESAGDENKNEDKDIFDGSNKNRIDVTTEGIENTVDGVVTESSTQVIVTVENQTKEVTNNISINPKDMTSSFTESSITKTITERTEIVTRTVSLERIHLTGNSSYNSDDKTLEMINVDGKVDPVKQSVTEIVENKM